MALLSLLFLALAAHTPDPKITKLLTVPQQYRRDVSATFMTGNQDFINKNCGGTAEKGYHTIGCSDESQQQLFMPNPCTFPEEKDVNSYAHILCHEIGHLNGWHHINE